MKKNLLFTLLIIQVAFWQAVNVAGAKQINFPFSQDQSVQKEDDKIKLLTANAWYWQTLSLAGKMDNVDAPQKYKLEFKSDLTVTVTADCNKAFGKFSVEGEKTGLTLGPSTLMQCPGNSRADQFVNLLTQVENLAVAGGKLLIVLKNEKGLLFMSPAPPAVVCGGEAANLSSVADTLDPKLSAELDDFLSRMLWDNYANPPGASLLVITPQGRYYKSVGVSDVANCTLLKADSPFQIGSNTKLMTSAIIFQLIEKGKLSLKDPIGKWLPELAAKIPNASQINIEMLLTHTSGIPDYFGSEANAEDIAGGVMNKATLTKAFTPQGLIETSARSGKADFAPGEAGKWKYSNAGYILLGLIIEKATGKSYEKNLQERIFKKLGLKKTYLQKGQPAPNAIPVAYYTQPFNYTTNEWNASQGWSAGAVVSTSEEFAVFLKSLFTGKLFKKKSTLEQMLSYPAAGKNALGEGTFYGHGMLNNNGVLGHGGQTLGFLSDGGYIPDKDITIVMWSNRATGATNRTATVQAAKILLGK